MLGKLFYAVTFCVGVPLLLAAWSVQLDAKFPGLPLVHSPIGGLVVGATGAALMLRAMWDLWRRGGGLPMNAFPPPRLVVSGAFRLVAHPIYVGAGLLLAGGMIFTGHAAGLWIVTPATCLAMLSLVIGYERIQLVARFGAHRTAAWLSLPPDLPLPPAFHQRTSALVLALVPWLVLYEACVRLGPGIRACDTMLAFERHWPVWVWTAPFYLGAYAWTALAPLAAPTQSSLRAFVRTALCGTVFSVWCFLALPLVAVPRELDDSTWLGRLLLFDRLHDTSACAFPSFHVFWAFAAADLWTPKIGRRVSRSIAVLIAASCITTGAHSVLDVLGGVLVYWGAHRCGEVWAALRLSAEQVANSWRDWRFGAVRVINHGAYVATAIAAGLWLVGLVLGPAHTPAILTVALCSVLGAGAWGQWLEASSQLSRPFGYFGGLFGGAAGIVVAHLCWGDGGMLLGAFSLAAPVFQGIGRLRCLGQGCCHGRPVADPTWGIRYLRPLSRVCQLAKLGRVPVYPTPLYSLLGNLAIFGLLMRLWIEGVDSAFIAGTYLILSTCARFMEEGYRGEPQTAHWAGLPIYQWLAISCLLAGVGLTALPGPVLPIAPVLSGRPLVYALPFGALVWCAMGIDFPASHRRLSRLA